MARELGIKIARVPTLSSYPVAEYAVTMMLTLNRKTHKAYSRVRNGNFSLEGLQGFDMNGKVVGIIGTGKAGSLTARILRGFGCQILAYDALENQAFRDLGGRYTSLEELLSSSHIVSLHAPLLPATRHMINRETIAKMKEGVMLINTSRGALIDTRAMVEGLESGHIGAVGIDVYEGEEELFHTDLSGLVLRDELFKQLMSFPNVLITGHQSSMTDSALESVAQTTLMSLRQFRNQQPLRHEIILG
uniref:D-lactate dehydrogenase n=1 Tax=Compsopogon caeruleus TaxID=31354 RepID=A0A7S1XCL0_9RHOD|mmetsp:Transcript_13212/g.26817  ORF Transcript_13212/g.26817 Transcript_13212/m.26817 type:complete len:247 (+) Transcript_13212:881-1621(+)